MSLANATEQEVCAPVNKDFKQSFTFQINGANVDWAAEGGRVRCHVRRASTQPILVEFDSDSSTVDLSVPGIFTLSQTAVAMNFEQGTYQYDIEVRTNSLSPTIIYRGQWKMEQHITHD